MMEPRSFISEHSIEYLVVLKVLNELHKEFGHISPLYFWRTREGSSLARNCLTYGIRMIAVYPRRPKVLEVGSNVITFKINDYVRNNSIYLSSQGIPCFYSGPIISTLDAYDINCDCFISKSARVHEYNNYKSINMPDAYITFVKEKSEIFCANMNDNIDIISFPEMLSFARQSKQMTWQKALEIIRELNMVSSDYMFFKSLAQYKPIFFIIH